MKNNKKTNQIYPPFEAAIKEAKTLGIMDPNTSEITKIERFKTNEKETQIWLNLKPLEAAFIVFRESAKGVTSVAEANDDHTYY